MNVVLIMPDQQRFDSLGCAGNKLLSTPNIDRVAAEGTLYSRAYSQSPLCQPARASFLTGRYPNQHGCVVNERGFPGPTDANFLHSLRAGGYHVASVGKVHVGVVPRGQPRFEHLQGYGFDEMDEVFGKMAYLKAESRYTELLREAGVLDAFRADLLERIAKMAADAPGSFIKPGDAAGVDAKDPWYAAPAPVPPELFIDSYVGDLAVEWLRNYDRDQPFFLWVGFCGPHDPHDAPQAYADRYLEQWDDIPVGSMAPPEATPSAAYNKLLDYFGTYSGTGHMEPDHVRRIRAFYYGNVTLIDDRIGDILRVLDERGLADDTWVVYTSDHGDILGDHQMLAKVLMYDGAVRIPMIVRPPRGAVARTVDGAVELADAGATILDALGLAPVPGSEARSLLGDGGGRPVIHTEVMGFTAIVTERYKYVVERDTGTPCVLFDLETDPDENLNLAADPASASLRDHLYGEHIKPFLAR
jgi:arylsulfatase A-like enzyme